MAHAIQNKSISENLSTNFEENGLVIFQYLSGVQERVVALLVEALPWKIGRSRVRIPKTS